MRAFFIAASIDYGYRFHVEHSHSLSSATDKAWKMSWKHYVYEIVTPKGVIYVGKGCGRRALISAKERGGDPIIVAYFQHPEWALLFERDRIAQRLAEGCTLKNVSHGNAVPWHQRADTQAMALEVLEWVADRIGRWVKAGRVPELSKIMRMPADELIALHQKFGH